MSNEKDLKVRIIHKHDIEANWLKATGFIPKLAELIVYEPDEKYNYSRYKIGDGVTAVNDLPFSNVQPDWNQNDTNAADYIKGRTHYSELAYSDTYLDYFDVNPYEAGIGIHPLVLAKEGKKTFNFSTFLDPEELQGYTLNQINYGLKLPFTYVTRATGKQTVIETNSIFFNKIEYIDNKNYKSLINAAYGLTIYAIRDINTLNDEYKTMFSEKGVYLEISVDPTANTSGYYSNISFRRLAYHPIDERYIPSAISRAADVETALVEKITAPTTADVGQTLIVKSVDSAGKPTAWETTDLLQSDWEQTDDTKLDFIKNKPDVITPDVILQMFSETGAAQPIADADNSVITTDDNKILIL